MFYQYNKRPYTVYQEHIDKRYCSKLSSKSQPEMNSVTGSYNKSAKSWSPAELVTDDSVDVRNFNLLDLNVSFLTSRGRNHEWALYISSYNCCLSKYLTTNCYINNIYCWKNMCNVLFVNEMYRFVITRCINIWKEQSKE